MSETGTAGDVPLAGGGAGDDTAQTRGPRVTPLETLDEESLELTRRLQRHVDQHLANEARQQNQQAAHAPKQLQSTTTWGHSHRFGSSSAGSTQQESLKGSSSQLSPSRPSIRTASRGPDSASTIQAAHVESRTHRDAAITGIEFVGDSDENHNTVPNSQNAGSVTTSGQAFPSAGAEAQPFGPSTLTRSLPADATSWDVELSKMIDLVRSEIDELDYTADAHDEYLRQHVNLRLLQFVNGQPEQALHSIPNIDADEQEFWQQLFWGLSNYFASQDYPDAAQRITFTADDLSRAVQKLRYRSLLKIQNMNFCSRINSFGSYDRIRVPRFRASQRVLIYAEMENFKSKELIASGEFQTKLSSVIQVYSGEQATADEPSKAQLLHTQKFATTVDLCNRPRRDFFNAYTYILPRDLTPGVHTLVLKVRDELSGNETVERLNFEVE